MNTVSVILLFVYCRNQENNVDTQCQSGSIQYGTIGRIPVSPQRWVVYWWCAVCRPCCDVIQFHERCFAHIHCPGVNNFRKQKLLDRGSYSILRVVEHLRRQIEHFLTYCETSYRLPVGWLTWSDLVWLAGWSDSILLHICEVLVFRRLRKIPKSDY